MDKPAKERIPLSEKYYICGVALWTRELFQLVGYIRPQKYDSNGWMKLIYHLRSLAFISTHLVALIFVEVAAVIMFWPDIPRVSGAAFILSANITHTVKLATLILNRDTFVGLVDFFVDSLSKRNLKDPKVLNIIISYEKIAFRDIVVILGLTTVAVIALVGVGDLMDPSGLPLVAWYPFEVNYSPMFELVFVHQMFAVLVAASLNVTLDMFTNNMVLQLCCQFELLKRDIEVIREISPEDHEEITRQLGDLIDRLCVLKRKCVELSQSCGVPVLAQFMGSIFIICISFYQFQRATETSIITIIAIFSMVMWAVLQAFFYCYYGNEIKTESQSIALALMQLPWYRFSQKNKKIFLLMTSMAQKPIILRAAGVINITLDALMSIIKTSYSFFSVMASMDKSGV